jgi:hypothetical protein
MEISIGAQEGTVPPPPLFRQEAPKIRHVFDQNLTNLSTKIAFFGHFQLKNKHVSTKFLLAALFL